MERQFQPDQFGFDPMFGIHNALTDEISTIGIRGDGLRAFCGAHDVANDEVNTLERMELLLPNVPANVVQASCDARSIHDIPPQGIIENHSVSTDANTFASHLSMLETSATCPSGVNILANGNFESNAAWVLIGSAAYSTYQPYEGTRCCSFNSSPDGKISRVDQTVDLLPDSAYKISYRARAIGATGILDIKPDLVYSTASGLDGVYYNFEESGLSSEFSKREFIFWLPAKATGNATFSMNSANTTPSTKTGYLDDVRLIRIGGNELIGTRYINCAPGQVCSLYTEPDGSTSIRTTIGRGEEVWAYSTNASGWLYVKSRGGMDGFCQETMISKTRPRDATFIGNRFIDCNIGSSVSTYGDATTLSEITSTLSRGTVVRAYDFGSTNFYLIQITSTGYSYDGYVLMNNTATIQPRNGVSLGIRYVNCPIGYAIYLFKDADLSSGYRWLIPRGQEVTVYNIGISGWVLVQTSSSWYGYCREEMLSSSKPRAATLIGTRYVNAPIGYTLYIFADASSGSPKKYSFNRGTEVRAYSIDVPGWVIVQNTATIEEGYVMESYLATTKPLGGEYLGYRYANVPKNSTLLVYANPDITQQKHSFDRGTEFIAFNSGVSGWTFVRHTTQTTQEGYCISTSLSNSKPVYDGVGEDRTNQYGWVGNNVNSDGLKVRSSPVDGSYSNPNLQRGERIFVLEQEGYNNIPWYKIRTDTGREGWVDSTYITFENPLTTGLQYVEVLNGGTFALTLPSGGVQVAYSYPANRRLIVSDYDATWYLTLYQGHVAYIKKSQCKILAVNVPNDICDRMDFIVANEIGRTDPGYFDNASGQWCQYFTNWLMKAAYLPTSRVPATGGTGNAIKEWCTTLGSIGTTFFYASGEHKAAIKNKYNISGSNDLLNPQEVYFVPRRGDLIYYLWDRDRDATDNNGDPIVVSHVDMVTSFDGTYISVVGGNRSSSIVGQGVYHKEDRQIVGYARPNYNI